MQKFAVQNDAKNQPNTVMFAWHDAKEYCIYDDGEILKAVSTCGTANDDELFHPFNLVTGVYESKEGEGEGNIRDDDENAKTPAVGPNPLSPLWHQTLNVMQPDYEDSANETEHIVDDADLTTNAEVTIHFHNLNPSRSHTNTLIFRFRFNNKNYCQ